MGRTRPKNEYCSNVLRHEATRERLLREATRACLLVQRGATSSYVTPPLNSYHRRLCHQLAELLRLRHETVPALGDEAKAVKLIHSLRPCECQSTCPGRWCALSLATAPANKCVVVSRRDTCSDDE